MERALGVVLQVCVRVGESCASLSNKDETKTRETSPLAHESWARRPFCLLYAHLGPLLQPLTDFQGAGRSTAASGDLCARIDLTEAISRTSQG
mmetsp:Transcript_10162/g.16639  ORF Transcript_10162/g.16639 Transcript_10162/m.16639 type:complete len:93 (+) Transcript_10162:15-293(+)